MASPHRPRLPPRPGLCPRSRHLRRLPHRHHRCLQRTQTSPRPRPRRRPASLRHEVHHHSPQPMGRRPHPTSRRRRRPVRPRHPPHPLPPLPPRGHCPAPQPLEPRPSLITSSVLCFSFRTLSEVERGRNLLLTPSHSQGQESPISLVRPPELSPRHPWRPTNKNVRMILTLLVL